jgi:alpha-L-fucosidase
MMKAALIALAATTFAGVVMAGQTEDSMKASNRDLKWWQDARFGMFIHWGPVSLMGTELSWSRGGKRPPGYEGTGEIPVDVYDNLYKRFNPTKYDAKEWVRIAKAAGMKYMVLTTKHHDGFTEWDSKATDYKITSPLSPYRKDIVRQFADACHAAGMRVGFYYSPLEFYNTDYRSATNDKWVKYMFDQVRELLTNYGKVDVIWFDGGSAKDYDAVALVKMCRKLQPHILINNRCGLPADFDTPEQTIGRFQNTWPWESCITIGTQWSYKPNDEIKSFRACIQTLVQCAIGDGNLLFDVGPMATGEIEPRQVARLAEMGMWLKANGDSVYGTRGGPILPSAWGGSTCKGKRVFLHVLDPNVTELDLPPLPAKAIRARALASSSGGDDLTLVQSDAGIRIVLPARSAADPDFVVAVDLDSDATKIPAVRPAER